MNLPAPLAPWAPYLQDFPLEVAPALGQLAQRVAALVGPMGLDTDQLDGEVDGYDGLARRGSPERMLLSEWLLAQEAPDEWSRRAAEGELSYLQLARRAPQQSKAVAVIFDGGPEVLGTPRLGQLAVLLVLARRARERGAELVWGIAQMPTEQLWRDFSPSGASALLETRVSAPVTTQDLDFWRESLPECDERWLVGGPQIAALAGDNESVLWLEDPLEAVRALDATARPHHGARREARLELPDDAICTRLLRDPFGTVREVAGQVRRVKNSLRPVSNLVWLGGHTLAARAGDGGILVFRVPSSPRGGVAKPKHYRLPDGDKAHCVGDCNGSIVAAQIKEAGVQIDNIGGKAQGFPTGFYRAETEDLTRYCARVGQAGRTDLHGEDAALTPWLQPLWNFKAAGSWLVLLLPDGTLCQLRPHTSLPVDVAAQGVLTPLLSGGEACRSEAERFGNDIVALVGGPAPRIVHLTASPSHSRGFEVREHRFDDEVEDAYWGGPRDFADPKARCGVLVYQAHGEWRMSWSKDGQGRDNKISPAQDEILLGVTGVASRWPSPGLLTRGNDGRGLALRGLGWSHQIASNETIKHVAACAVTPYVAYTTPRELVVYSLSLDVVLARWQWEESE
ncbi:MAG: hypothetical protein KY445_15130 [Armatimonadetes bacterium]|nr:hypothetical protein [Armatimonadota bacterium]